MHLHIYELDHVNAVIAQNHRDARRAEQRRLLKGGGPNAVAAMVMQVRATILSLLAGPGGSMDPARIPDPEPEPAPVIR